MNWEKIAAGLDEIEDKNKPKAKEKKLDNTVQDIVTNLLNNVNPKEIHISDTTDLKTVYDIYSKSMDKENNANGGGTLPPLSTGLENIIENAVHVSYRSVQQDDGTVKQEKTISADDIAKMSPEEIANLMAGKEKIQNNDNAEKIM